MKFVGRSVWLFAAAAPLGAVAGSVAAFDADGRGPKKVGRELAGGGGKQGGQGGQGTNGGGGGQGGNNGKKPAASGSRGYSTLGLEDAPPDALQQLAAETDEAVTNKPKSLIGGRMGRGNGGQGKGGGGGQGGGGQGGGQGKPKRNARRLENTTAEVTPAGHLIMTPDLSESQLEAFGVYLNDTAQEGLGYHNRIEEGDDGHDEVEMPAEVEDDTTNDGDDAAPDYEGDDGGEELVEGAMEETTGAGNVFESDGRRRLRGTKRVHRKLGQNEIPDTNALGTFYPLDCNTGMEAFDCSSNLFSALVSDALGGAVEVPCGQCYTYDLDGGEFAARRYSCACDVFFLFVTYVLTHTLISIISYAHSRRAHHRRTERPRQAVRAAQPQVHPQDAVRDRPGRAGDERHQPHQQGQREHEDRVDG